MSLQIAFVATAPSSSLGTSTAKSISRRWPMSIIRQPDGGLRKRAIVSMGRCVADRPMRTGLVCASAASRSNDSAKCAPRLLEQGIKTGEEGGERLAGAGGRGDQDVLARRDRRPASGLHIGGRAEARAEPLCNDRMKPG